MKQVKNLITIILGILVMNTVAFGQNAKSQFKITSEGKVEKSGVILGTIESDGTIKDSKGNVKGKIMGSMVHDKTGKKMAEISEDGSLKDGKGKVLYTVSSADEAGFCTVKDKNGNVIGLVDQNYKKQGACAIHCLAEAKK